LWRKLELDAFWAARLPLSRKGTRWDQVLETLVAYRLVAPGSEWRLHREWFGNNAMPDLLGADFGLVEAHKLYSCHDRLLQRKETLHRGVRHSVTWRLPQAGLDLSGLQRFQYKA